MKSKYLPAYELILCKSRILSFLCLKPALLHFKAHKYNTLTITCKNGDRCGDKNYGKIIKSKLEFRFEIQRQRFVIISFNNEISHKVPLL
jgi:hypothetical protein